MRTIALSTLLTTAACTGSVGTDGPKDTEPTVETGETGTDSTPTYTLATSGLDGTVSTDVGPLEAAGLRLCRGALCRNGETDALGAFNFEFLPALWHSFEVVAPLGSGLATPFAPLAFEEDEIRTVTVNVPLLDPASPLGAGIEEHAVGNGLYVSLSVTSLEAPLFADDATEVAGVRVSEPLWLPVDDVAGTVLAMWYVGPFDYHAIGGDLPLRIVNEWALADGTDLQVYVGSYVESAWVDAGTATVVGGDITGAAIPLLSTVILVQP